MKVTRLFISLLLLCALPAMAMTDQQVIEYIKAQAAAGKSQDEIGAELLAKGVSTDQIQRIKSQYEKGNKSSGLSSSSNSAGTRTRGRKSASDVSARGASDSQRSAASTGSQVRGQRVYAEADEYGDVGIIPDTPEGNIVIIEENSNQGLGIYGHEVFGSKFLTFEPNANLSIPKDYRLGPGDEVIIDIWGASEDNIRQEISPDGSILISQVGPVYLNGMTVAQANNHIKNIFSKKYAGIGTDTDVNLTVGNIRSIQVDVMGEVSTPGTFRLSPFSSVFHAIYGAGGINDIGSLRNIQVLRNGKVISNVDVYDFIFKGKDTGNVRLQEGDVIIVPPYSELVKIEGNVKRPMFYELKPSESLQKLIEYAGGFSGSAYSDVVRVQRKNGLDNDLYTIEKREYPSYTLKDGDVVTIGEVTDRFTNRVELRGAVNRPGTYAISDNLKTLKGLINSAEGLAEDAFLNRALIYRETPDRSLEVIAVNIGKIMDGSIADIYLNKNDIVEIANVNSLTERGNLTISGLVANPGEFPYAKGTTVEDLILRAGGLREGASTARVDISRRIVDPTATDASATLSQVFQFDIEGGITVGEGKGFILEPYDVVQIRKSPAYSSQEFVTLQGQILFPGNYVLESRNERISSVIKRAGGLIDGAYVEGASLRRNVTEEEKLARQETIRLAYNAEDDDTSLNMNKMELSDNYYVGIDLKKALENPGSSYDFVLQEGDVLVVPDQQSTVKIQGEVLFPNTIVYVPGKNLNYYIQQAGGYSQRAKKSKAYIVYMNGSVAKAKRNSSIEPGCQIVVPTKPESLPFDWARVLTIASSLGSVATLAASVATMIK